MKNNGRFIVLTLLILAMAIICLPAMADTVVNSEEELRAAVSAVNSAGGKNTIVLGADIMITNNGEISFTNGETTILGNSHTLSVYQLSVYGNAVLNLGKKNSDDTLTVTSSCNNSNEPDRAGNLILLATNNATVNMYSGVTLGHSTARATTAGCCFTRYSTFNMYGGLITDCVITEGSTAGGVDLNDHAVFNMYDGEISDCHGVAGGAVACSGADIGTENGLVTFNMYGGTIKNCTSRSYGGAAVCYYVGSAAEFNMSGGLIEYCDAVGETPEASGGAIFLLENTRANITGGEIRYCSAKNGGAIFAEEGMVAIGGTAKIHHNKATTGDGGAINSALSTVVINGNAEIYNNSVETSPCNGGVIFFSGTCTIEGNAKIYNNSSKGYGGVAYIVSKGTLNIGENAQLYNNTAARYGGAVMVAQGYLNIKGPCLIKNNEGTQGGAIYQHSISTNSITIEDCEIVKATPHNQSNSIHHLQQSYPTFNRRHSNHTVRTPTRPAYATQMRLRARYRFASANSVQQC